MCSFAQICSDITVHPKYGCFASVGCSWNEATSTCEAASETPSMEQLQPEDSSTPDLSEALGAPGSPWTRPMDAEQPMDSGLEERMGEPLEPTMEAPIGEQLDPMMEPPMPDHQEPIEASVEEQHEPPLKPTQSEMEMEIPSDEPAMSMPPPDTPEEPTCTWADFEAGKCTNPTGEPDDREPDIGDGNMIDGGVLHEEEGHGGETFQTEVRREATPPTASSEEKEILDTPVTPDIMGSPVTPEIPMATGAVKEATPDAEPEVKEEGKNSLMSLLKSAVPEKAGEEAEKLEAIEKDTAPEQTASIPDPPPPQTAAPTEAAEVDALASSRARRAEEELRRALEELSTLRDAKRQLEADQKKLVDKAALKENEHEQTLNRFRSEARAEKSALTEELASLRQVVTEGESTRLKQLQEQETLTEVKVSRAYEDGVRAAEEKYKTKRAEDVDMKASVVAAWSVVRILGIWMGTVARTWCAKASQFLPAIAAEFHLLEPPLNIVVGLFSCFMTFLVFCRCSASSAAPPPSMPVAQPIVQAVRQPAPVAAIGPEFAAAMGSLQQQVQMLSQFQERTSAELRSVTSETRGGITKLAAELQVFQRERSSIDEEMLLSTKEILEWLGNGVGPHEHHALDLISHTLDDMHHVQAPTNGAAKEALPKPIVKQVTIDNGPPQRVGEALSPRSRMLKEREMEMPVTAQASYEMCPESSMDAQDSDRPNTEHQQDRGEKPMAAMRSALINTPPAAADEKPMAAMRSALINTPPVINEERELSMTAMRSAVVNAPASIAEEREAPMTRMRSALVNTPAPAPDHTEEDQPEVSMTAMRSALISTPPVIHEEREMPMTAMRSALPPQPAPIDEAREAPMTAMRSALISPPAQLEQEAAPGPVMPPPVPEPVSAPTAAPAAAADAEPAPAPAAPQPAPAATPEPVPALVPEPVPAPAAMPEPEPAPAPAPTAPPVAAPEPVAPEPVAQPAQAPVQPEQNAMSSPFGAPFTQPAGAPGPVSGAPVQGPTFGGPPAPGPTFGGAPAPGQPFGAAPAPGPPGNSVQPPQASAPAPSAGGPPPMGVTPATGAGAPPPVGGAPPAAAGAPPPMGSAPPAVAGGPPSMGPGPAPQAGGAPPPMGAPPAGAGGPPAGGMRPQPRQISAASNPFGAMPKDGKAMGARPQPKAIVASSSPFGPR